jgi:hypothetical protein
MDFKGPTNNQAFTTKRNTQKHYKTSQGCNQKSQAYMAMTLYTMFCDFEFVKNIFLQTIQPLHLETCLIVEKL